VLAKIKISISPPILLKVPRVVDDERLNKSTHVGAEFTHITLESILISSIAL